MAASFVLPRRDGDVGSYDVPAHELFFHREGEVGKGQSMARRRPPRTGNYRVVFVNGQAGNPEKHAQQARATAAATGGPVTGIYNAGAQVAGIVQDTVQSLSDKWTSANLMAARAWVNRLVLGDQAAKEALVRHLEGVFVGNRATVSLFLDLCDHPKVDTRIVCHSQGNIIVCNALNALRALNGPGAMQNKSVFAIASPVYSWGENKNLVRDYRFANDPIALLGRNEGTDLGRHHVGKKAVVDPSNRSEMVLGYERAKGLGLVFECFVHSYYIYLAHLWDEFGTRFE